MTLKTLSLTATQFGYSVRKRDGEYRVAPVDQTPLVAEEQAYYTDDIEDAYSTLFAMAEDQHRCNESSEVFRAKEHELEDNIPGTYLPAGWYWWACFPGCLPDSPPIGPFDTEWEAREDRLLDYML